MGIEAKTNNYWIAPNALSITLNALGDGNRIQGSVSSGSVISCYIESVTPGGENGDGLGLDNGRNPKRWSLGISPTFFNSDTAKYVYVAIPRSASHSTQAVVVFPSEKIDLYGKNENDEQIGSMDYFYVWLQGIISAPTGENLLREWTQPIVWGSLGTYEDIVDMSETEWYSYSALLETVTLLKKIVMKAGSFFQNIFLGDEDHELTGVATAATDNEFIDSDKLVVTPNYIKQHYLRKDADDTASGQIGFIKGLWIKAAGLFGFSEDGDVVARSLKSTGSSGETIADTDNATRKNLGLEVAESGIIGGILRVAKSILTKTIQSLNFTGGDSMFGTGWQLTDNDGNGNSRLVVDNLFVRMKAVFNELEVRKFVAMAGNYVFSPAASIIEEVDYIGHDENDHEIVVGYEYVKVPWVLRLVPLSIARKMLSKKKMVRSTMNESKWALVDTFRCWLKSDDGTTRTINTWAVGMLARCQTFNIANGSEASHQGTWNDDGVKSVANKLYWRAVTGVGEAKTKDNYSLDNHILEDGLSHNYIDLSNEAGMFLTGSDKPEAFDHVVCYGDWKDRTLSNIITIETVGSQAPCFREILDVGYTDGTSIDWTSEGQERTRISPVAGNKFVAPSFIVTTEGSEKSAYDKIIGHALGFQGEPDVPPLVPQDGSVVLITYNDIKTDNAIKTASYVEVSATDLNAPIVVNGEFVFRKTGGNDDVATGPAFIENIKGNTVAWHQLCEITSVSSRILVKDDTDTTFDTYKVIANPAANSIRCLSLSATNKSISSNHKVLFVLIFKSNFTNKPHLRYTDGNTTNIGATGDNSYTKDAWNTYMRISDGITAAATSGLIVQRAYIEGEYISLPKNGGFQVYDLTLIYGAGNEPSTPAQFEADYFKRFGKPLAYEPYDEGSLRNVQMEGIKSVGFNQWDEQWEVGNYDTSTGKPSTSVLQIRSKSSSPIRVLPNSIYCFTNLHYRVSQILWYDNNDNYIGRVSNPNQSTFTTTSPINAFFCRFQCPEAYGTTYNNDICINISDPAKNGTYEPYKSETRNFDVTTLTGKLNGEGESVVIFPDGMKGVNDVQDEIYIEDGVTKAVKRIGNRAYQSGDESNSNVITDGTITYYKLAEPQVYVLDAPLPIAYNCEAGGTEQILPENSSTPTSVAPILRLRYGEDHELVWNEAKANLGDAYISDKNGHRYVATSSGWEDRGLHDDSTIVVDINGIKERVTNEFDGLATELSLTPGQASLVALVNFLESAGIHIDGVNSSIVAKADNFEIQNQSGTKTFGVNANGDLEGFGGASFKGKIIALSGEFYGNIRTIIKEIHESDAQPFNVSYPLNAHGFILNSDLNLRVDRFLDYSELNINNDPTTRLRVAIVLPRDTDYIGCRVTLWNAMIPPYSRVDMTDFYSTLLCENRSDCIQGFPSNFEEGSEDIYSYSAPNYVRWLGGFIELIGVPGISFDPNDNYLGEICIWNIISISATSYSKGYYQS